MLRDYDDVAESYATELDRAVQFVGRDHRFFARAKAEALLEIVARRLGAVALRSMLNVGCGTGLMDDLLSRRVGTLVGTDISQRSLERASASNPRVRYELATRERLPFDDATFDVAFAATVVQVLPLSSRSHFVAELARVTRPGGLVAIVEHNPRNPLTRLTVRRFTYREDVRMLGGGEALRLLHSAGLRDGDIDFFLFTPLRSRAMRWVERRIARLPLGAQFVATAERAPRPTK